MLQKHATTIIASNKTPTSLDINYDDSFEILPIIILCHGFKGFKDWGGFNLVAEQFAQKGFCVVKFNFSHNGTSLQKPGDFVDLEKFAINTFTHEMEDIKAVENFITTELKNILPQIDTNNISIIGHSKGGVSSILYCANYKTAIKKICTWASPIDFFRFWNASFLNQWRANGVQYIFNARTKQQMPLSIEILNDYEKNIETYNVQKALAKITLPYLIVHGKNDESVNISHAIDLHKASSQSELSLIENTGHTFDMVHPFTENVLPEKTLEVIDKTISFLK